MKKIAIILAIIITILYINNNNDTNIIIPDESIRIRIIANSNNIEDQMLKLKIKKQVENTLNKTIKKSKNISEARFNIKNNLDSIDEVLKNTLINNNYELNYGINYFPKKELHGIIYEAGDYESLVIKIGEAKGNNWWCVLFPPLCLVDAEIEENNNIEYKSKILEILNKYN